MLAAKSRKRRKKEEGRRKEEGGRRKEERGRRERSWALFCVSCVFWRLLLLFVLVGDIAEYGNRRMWSVGCNPEAAKPQAG
jgi:hypothetical protein